jgi:uncharacterized peroxidase-related enzyme
MTQSISRFPLVEDLAALPADVRERILAVQEKAGFVPNVFFAYHDALMERESTSLTKAEKEMIVVAVSADHGCLYCVVAHGAILRILAKDPLIADQVAVNYRTAPISQRQRGMLDFALHLAAKRGVLDDAWQTRLESLGFTLDDIWDIGAIAALFGLSNRLVSMARTPPNDEFYLLGRVPKPAAS